jgi:hypothetical protein
VLQEFDLPPGITVIGRSLDCHLTIEDALVSRRHAQTSSARRAPSSRTWGAATA